MDLIAELIKVGTPVVVILLVISNVATWRYLTAKIDQYDQQQQEHEKYLIEWIRYGNGNREHPPTPPPNLSP